MNKDNEVLVVRCNAPLSRVTEDYIRDHIIEQMKTGVVVLPNICEAIIVPKDIEVKVELYK